MARAPYNPQELEPRMQKRWAKDGIYRTEDDAEKEKRYVLDMFPYPSGDGLHVGHPKGYIATDVYARHARMRGYNVLHPMGWDAFGLPAENYALKNKVHPRAAVEKNIARFKAQLEKIGFDYDWSREVNTTDPEYYHWTQWIFLKLYEHGLAFRSEEPINWCPSCKTGLANEDVEQGRCERCDTPVEKKTLPQWVLKITDYADRLLNDLELLPRWPEHIKESQRNWIGRSEGAEIRFEVRGSRFEGAVDVFTTRADTLFGATYLVLAPEHPVTAQLLGASGKVQVENAKDVRDYVARAARVSEIDRTAENREKTGVKLEGVTATNPATGEQIPIFVADYVLGSYGTGAIMAVPAHDLRDYAFAQKFGLPIKEVVVEQVTPRNSEGQYRRIVVAVVENRKGEILIQSQDRGEGEYFCLPGGGVDAGEEPQESVLREVAEETGYFDFSEIKKIGTVEANYFQPIRKIRRQALATGYFMRLGSDRQRALELTELEKKATMKNAWRTKDEAARLLFGDRAKRVEDRALFERYLRDEMGQPFSGNGVLVDSGEFDGMESAEARKEITARYGRAVVKYKLRDWVFSRQRYWGEPIPILYCEKCGTVPVPYEDLPVKLPEVERYEPTGTGESPLAAITDWVNTTCPKCGGAAKRETNTMPQWAGSSWYYLRYCDPHNNEELASQAKLKYWLGAAASSEAPRAGGVDVYVGGAEHATRHLIYARFWHKFLYDIGVLSTKEPFEELHSVGLIIAEDGRKMSKRFGNVVNPDDIVAEYGADALRVYEMFMGPFENAIAWNTQGLAGARRFLDRVWRLAEHVQEEAVPALERPLARTVKKVGDDILAFRFNTAVSQMMIFINAAEDAGKIGKEEWRVFVRVLAPFAPHLSEALWQEQLVLEGSQASINGTESVHKCSWPEYDAALLVEDEAEIAVQVNGKTRGTLRVPRTASEADAVASARALPAVSTALAGKIPSRTIYVPGRILNLVV